MPDKTPAEEWTRIHREILLTLYLLLAGVIIAPIVLIVLLALTH